MNKKICARTYVYMFLQQSKKYRGNRKTVVFFSRPFIVIVTPKGLKMRTASRSQFSVHHRLLLFPTLIKSSPSFLPPFEFSSPDRRNWRISSAWVSKFPLSIPFWTRPYFHSSFDPSLLEWLLLIPVNLRCSCSHRWRWYSSLTMERPPFQSTVKRAHKVPTWTCKKWKKKKKEKRKNNITLETHTFT